MRIPLPSTRQRTPSRQKNPASRTPLRAPLRAKGVGHARLPSASRSRKPRDRHEQIYVPTGILTREDPDWDTCFLTGVAWLDGWTTRGLLATRDTDIWPSDLLATAPAGACLRGAALTTKGSAGGRTRTGGGFPGGIGGGSQPGPIPQRELRVGTPLWSRARASPLSDRLGRADSRRHGNTVFPA
jgi:hypothetical protein